MVLLYYVQDINAIMELLKSRRAAKAGIVYLQDETYEFRTKENDELRSVYGSPVRSSVILYLSLI